MNASRRTVTALISISLMIATATTIGCDTPQGQSVAPEAARALSLFGGFSSSSATISVADAEDFDLDRPTE